MPYVTSWERIATKQGLQKGLQQGLQRGLQQGLQQGLEDAREMVLEVLEERFGVVSPDIAERISTMQDRGILRALPRLAVQVRSLEEFETQARL